MVFVFISGIGTSYAASILTGEEVSFDNTSANLTKNGQPVANMQDAVDALYQHATDYTEIKGVTLGNAGFHNSVFRGENLGTSITNEQWSAISSGTFDDLYVGDYWELPYDGNTVTFRIAGFDIYYGKGDTEMTAHHAVIVPDTNLTSSYMNSSHTTAGGYVGSYMYTTTLPSVKTKIETTFGSSHVLSYRALLTTRVNTSATNRYPGTTGSSDTWAWYDAKVNLMNMVQVTGNIGFSSSGFDTGADNVQFPLFRLRPEFINKARSWYWVRDVASSSAFAVIGTDGVSGPTNASNAGGVRPCFYIG